MKLTSRLQCIADLVSDTKKLADIGTDHGKLPIYLVKNNIIDSAIAADINQGPLNNAVEGIRMESLEKEIKTRISDGIKEIDNGEVDTLIIAGMGGILIKEILEDNIIKTESFRYLILQPMTRQHELREWLINQEYNIETEQIVIEGSKYYEIIKLDMKSRKEYRDIGKLDYEIGISMKKDENYKKFILYRINKYDHLVEGTKHLEDDTLYNENSSKLLKLKEILKCL